MGLTENGPSHPLRALFNLPSCAAPRGGGVKRAVEWLERINLTDRARRSRGPNCPMVTSGGWKSPAPCAPSRYCYARRAGGGLNPRESLALNGLLPPSVRNSPTSLLLIEHDMSVVMGISDHIVVLEYGRKIADGTRRRKCAPTRASSPPIWQDEDAVEAVEAEVGV